MSLVSSVVAQQILDDLTVDVTIQVVRRIELQPDDIVVVSYPGSLPDGIYKRLSNELKKSMGGQKVIVMEDGMKIEGILRPVEQEND